MKTYSPKPRDIERRWYVLDASGAILGRLATQAATILRGKHKPIFAPHADTGDHVIVINAKDVTLSGGKENKKIAYHHSGYPGGLTETVYSRLLAKRPAFAVEKAIKGMLPHNRLGRQMASKLRVYAGADHRHEAQKPQALAPGEFPTWSGLPEGSATAEAAPKTHPGPKAPAARPTTARRATATSPAQMTGQKTGQRTGQKTGRKTTVKRTTSKTTAKRTTARATTAKRTTAKATAGTKTTAKKTTAQKTDKKTTAKRTTKKET
jgi:large subunit ribosomal protein L13